MDLFYLFFIRRKKSTGIMSFCALKAEGTVFLWHGPSFLSMWKKEAAYYGKI